MHILKAESKNKIIENWWKFYKKSKFKIKRENIQQNKANNWNFSIVKCINLIINFIFYKY